MTDLCDVAVVGHGQPGASAVTWSRRPLVSCVLLGVGLGGFVDGIVLHQILSGTTAHGHRRPPGGHRGRARGQHPGRRAFHAAAWISSPPASWCCGGRGPWSDRRRPAGAGRCRARRVGAFNLVEGIVDHHLLGVHDVRDDVADPLWWNVGFLVLGALLVAVGVVLVRRGGPRRRARQVRARRRVSIVSPIRVGTAQERRVQVIVVALGIGWAAGIPDRHDGSQHRRRADRTPQHVARVLRGRVRAVNVSRPGSPSTCSSSRSSRSPPSISTRQRGVEGRRPDDRGGSSPDRGALGMLTRPPPTTRAGPGSCPGRRST